MYHHSPSAGRKRFQDRDIIQHSSYGKKELSSARDLPGAHNWRPSSGVFEVLELERPCSERMSTGDSPRRKAEALKPQKPRTRTPRSARWAGLFLARAGSDWLLSEERGVPEGPSSTAERNECKRTRVIERTKSITAAFRREIRTPGNSRGGPAVGIALLDREREVV